MSHYSYIRGSLGAWATGTPVSQAEFWQLDQNQFASINGDAGGTWAPSNVIAIGGSGVTIASAPFSITGTGSITVAGTAQFNGTFAAIGSSITLGNSSLDTVTIDGTTTFGSPATFSDALTANGNITLGNATTDALYVNATTTIRNDAYIGETSSDEFQVNSTVTFNSPEIHNDAETHVGNETHAGEVNFNGVTYLNESGAIGNAITDIWTLNGIVRPGNGARVVDGGYFMPDSDTTLSTYYKHVYCPGMTANRKLKIDFSGMYVGDSVTVWLKNSAGFILTIQNVAGTVDYFYLDLSAFFSRVKLVWNGSAWDAYGTRA